MVVLLVPPTGLPAIADEGVLVTRRGDYTAISVVIGGVGFVLVEKDVVAVYRASY